MNSTNLNMTNSTNVTMPPTPPPRPPHLPPFLYRTQSAITAQVIAFAVLGIIIVLGNLASIVTFIKTQSLRKKSNYMLINLAVADFLIAIATFFNSYYFSDRYPLHPLIVRHSLEIIDVFTGTSSLICLAVIAAERFYAVVFPFKHRVLRLRHYLYVIPIPWGFALIIILVFVRLDFPMVGTRLYSYLLIRYSILLVALIIMIIAYLTIWLKRPMNTSSSNIGAYNKKLSVTLFIVTLASMLTWLPLQCFGFAFFVERLTVYPHVNYFITLKFLQYTNSAMNFFIYVLRMRDFRLGLIELLGVKQSVNRASNTDGSTISSARQSVQNASTISSI